MFEIYMNKICSIVPYKPHYDFARREEINAFKSLNSGNRIATVLYYVSCPTPYPVNVCDMLTFMIL